MFFGIAVILASNNWRKSNKTYPLARIGRHSYQNPGRSETNMSGHQLGSVLVGLGGSRRAACPRRRLPTRSRPLLFPLLLGRESGDELFLFPVVKERQRQFDDIPLRSSGGLRRPARLRQTSPAI